MFLLEASCNKNCSKVATMVQQTVFADENFEAKDVNSRRFLQTKILIVRAI